MRELLTMMVAIICILGSIGIVLAVLLDLGFFSLRIPG